MSSRLKTMLKVVVAFFVATLVLQFAFTAFSSTQKGHSNAAPIRHTRAAKKTTKHHKKTQPKVYPDLSKYPNAWLKVSLKHQRVYIMNDNTKLYTMLASTGMNNSTPTGTFTIEPERGTYFYTPRFKEGAYDWVSWKDHGVYLFHSTPTDEQKHVLPGPEADLGKRPSSHGCVHLSLADAHWVYQHVPTGMKVVITKS